MSYIDEALPLLARRAALRGYGFVCACRRCAEEEAAGAGDAAARREVPARGGPGERAGLDDSDRAVSAASSGSP